jgi:hypothetical protein
MNKHNEQSRTQRLIGFISYLVVMSLFCAMAMATMTCPPAPKCYHYKTDWPGCDLGWNCGSAQKCCDGDCRSNCGECCGKYCGCNSANCETCVDGQCVSKCDPAKCETCDGHGNCIVCGGDTNKTCCNGSCCDKVWKSRSIESITEHCSFSDCGAGGCTGTATQTSEYQVCEYASDGTGTACTCTEELRVVGYVYTCETNWDCERILWCAGRGSWCAAVCIVSCPVGAVSACANCLAGASTDCCYGGCDLCDFVESCDESYPVEVRSVVLTYIGC